MNPLVLALSRPDLFSQRFVDYLKINLHIWDAFETQALLVAAHGFEHYGARTIIEALRHHTALHEVGGAWKINDRNIAYFARLFALAHPVHQGLFEFRHIEAV
jgi:hypothetical protein